MKRNHVLETIAGMAVVIVATRSLDRVSDERNIRALARHVGCSLDEARRLYRASRETGYGSAYESMFGTGVDRIEVMTTEHSWDDEILGAPDAEGRRRR